MNSQALSLLPGGAAVAVNDRARARIVAALLVGGAYYAGSILGFALTFEPRPVSVLWFPNAVVLAGLLLRPRREWPLLLAAAFVAHMLAQLPARVPPLMVLCWFVSNSAEALLGGALITHYTRSPFRLNRFRNVVVFVASTFLAVFSTSFLDAAFVALNDWGATGYWTVWRTRFFSNVLTVLTVVPTIVGLSSVLPGSLRGAPGRVRVEAIMLMAGLLLASVWVFGTTRVGPDAPAALLYVPLPFMLWAAVRFGPGAAGGAVLATALVATLSAVHGRGPFASAAAEDNALQIQLLFSTVAITQIVLAAVLAERKHAQEAVWRSQEQLRLAVGAAQMTTWDWTVAVGENGRARPGWLGVTSGTPTGMLLHPLEARLGTIDNSDRQRITRAFARAMHHDVPIDVQFRVIQPDGTVRWKHGLGRVLTDMRRGQVRVVGLSADVSERKLAEDLQRGETRILQLIAAGASLRETLSSIGRLIESECQGLVTAFLLVDRDGAHARYYAAPRLPATVVRRIGRIRIAADAGPCGSAIHLRQPVHTIDTRGDPLLADLRASARGHELRSCWATPIVLENGEVPGALALYFDTTRRPTERQLQLAEIAQHLAAIAIERWRAELVTGEQRQALTHLGRVAVLGEMAGALAHELSQPLTVVLSEAQAARRMLCAPQPDSPELERAVDEIIAAERRAGLVIDRMRAMLERRPPTFARLDLNAVVRETLRLMRRDLAEREVAVVTRLDARLPAVAGDRVELQQVLLNLCLNACDAMRDTALVDRAILIATRPAPEEDAVEVTVTDSGPGISDEVMRRLFEPFFTTKERGLGLGMPICHTIVSAHCGRLFASNNADRGATMHMILPALSAAPDTCSAATVPAVDRR